MEPGRRLIHCHPCRKSGTLAQQRKAEEGIRVINQFSRDGQHDQINVFFYVSHFFQMCLTLCTQVPFKIYVSKLTFFDWTMLLKPLRVISPWSPTDFLKTCGKMSTTVMRWWDLDHGHLITQITAMYWTFSRSLRFWLASWLRWPTAWALATRSTTWEGRCWWWLMINDGGDDKSEFADENDDDGIHPKSGVPGCPESVNYFNFPQS